MKTMKILVTAGPTREPIDAVRFISNRSSGRMGYALAAVAVEREHQVRLISGPVSVSPPPVHIVNVNTAEEMLIAVKENLTWCDVLIMAAAVTDFRPKNSYSGKLRKADGMPALELEPTPDVLKTIAPLKGHRIFVGFAAETGNLVREGNRKLLEKNLDLIVANEIGRADSGFESATNKAVLIAADGFTEELPLMIKKELASRIIEWIEQRAVASH